MTPEVYFGKVEFGFLAGFIIIKEIDSLFKDK